MTQEQRTITEYIFRCDLCGDQAISRHREHLRELGWKHCSVVGDQCPLCVYNHQGEYHAHDPVKPQWYIDHLESQEKGEQR